MPAPDEFQLQRAQPIPRYRHVPPHGRTGANGVDFEIGVRKTFQARSDGRLFLGINDDSLANNSGFWTATVTVLRAR